VEGGMGPLAGSDRQKGYVVVREWWLNGSGG